MRNRSLSLAVFALVSYLFASCAFAEDWPQWRGPRSDGSWQAPKIPERFPEGGPKIEWKSPVAAGYSGIAVVGNRVYTMDKPKEPADRERVLCLDAVTGKPVWEHVYPAAYGKLDYGKGPRATPTVFEGRVYTFGAVGHVHCLDALTGNVLWSKDLVADHKAEQPTWGFAASPVIHDGKVIIHAGLKGNGCFSAYDLTTGNEVWRGGSDPAGYGTPILVKHEGVEQLVGWTPENLVSHSPQTGRLNWSVPYKINYGVSIA